MSSSRSLYVHSGQRLEGTSVSQATYRLPYAIGPIKGVTLKQFSIYNTKYNIDAKNNQVSIWRPNKARVDTISIPYGFYKASELIKTLESKVNEISADPDLQMTIERQPDGKLLWDSFTDVKEYKVTIPQGGMTYQATPMVYVSPNGEPGAVNGWFCQLIDSYSWRIFDLIVPPSIYVMGSNLQTGFDQERMIAAMMPQGAKKNGWYWQLPGMNGADGSKIEVSFTSIGGQTRFFINSDYPCTWNFPQAAIGASIHNVMGFDSTPLPGDYLLTGDPTGNGGQGPSPDTRWFTEKPSYLFSGYGFYRNSIDSMVIPAGQYSIAALCVEMTNASTIFNVNEAITWDVDEKTNKVYYHCESVNGVPHLWGVDIWVERQSGVPRLTDSVGGFNIGNAFNMNMSTGNAYATNPLPTFGDFQFVEGTTMATVLGLPSLPYPETAALTVTTPAIANLNPSTGFYVCSNVLAGGSNLTLDPSAMTNIMERIPYSAEPQGLIHFISPNGYLYRTPSSRNYIQEFDISLIDEETRLPIEWNGSEYTMALEFDLQ